jgi:hypothetical protein
MSMSSLLMQNTFFQTNRLKNKKIPELLSQIYMSKLLTKTVLPAGETWPLSIIAETLAEKQ